MRERSDSEEGWHRSIYTAHLARVVARSGITTPDFLAGTGVTEAVLADPNGRISSADILQLWRRAIALTGEPGLGFHHGLEVKLSAHGAVGLAVLTSSTMADALAVAERFFALRAHHLALSHSVEGDDLVIQLEETRPLGDLRVFVFESVLTSVIHIMTMLAGKPIPARFELSYPEPAHFQGFAHLWPGPARFDRATTRIFCAKAVLSLPIAMADPLAAERAVLECEQELAMLGETSNLLARVRRLMRAQKVGFPTLSELAAKMHVSSRTMKRQLGAHGVSYTTILDELRRDRALALLESEDATVERIAIALGYADPSNFNRAFKRWMGEPPTEWKRRNAG